MAMKAKKKYGVTATKPRISKALLKDLEAVFSKHDFRGVLLTKQVTAASGGCPEGTTPHTVYRMRDGKIVAEVVCVPDNSPV